MAEKDRAAAAPTIAKTEKSDWVYDDGAVEKLDDGEGIVSTYSWTPWFAWYPVLVPGMGGWVWLRTIERRVVVRDWYGLDRASTCYYRPAARIPTPN